MSRQYTKISANKPAPKKKMIKQAVKMSARLKGSGGFAPLGGK